MQLMKLGVQVLDNATGLKGILTHAEVSMDHSVRYQFRPRGLDAETHMPVKGLWVDGERVEGGTPIETDLPLGILGTEVEEINSGFKGKAVAIVQHLSGCVHIVIQARGSTKNGDPIQPMETDILLLKGKAIPKKTEVQKEEHKKKFPSPAPVALSRFELIG